MAKIVNKVAKFEKVSFEQFEKDGNEYIFNARFVDMKEVYKKFLNLLVNLIY